MTCEYSTAITQWSKVAAMHSGGSICFRKHYHDKDQKFGEEWNDGVDKIT